MQQTRMHSSRMRIVHCSGRQGGGVSTQQGSAWGVFAQGGLPGGGLTPPPSGHTDTCENITFPQLLLLSGRNSGSIK